jgi:Amt family ammonium transporter
MSDTAVWFALCLVFILLVPLSIAGLALINTGLGRSRSAAHGMTSSLSVVAVAGLVYFVFGFSVQAYPVNFAKMVMADQRVLGAPGLFLRGVDYGFPLLPVVLGIFSVGLASIVPLGAAADRLRLGAACLATVIFAGLTYPGFAHWAVNGFLSQLVSNPAIGRSYLDDGGSGMIQASGGLAALSLAWLVGPRRGKYSSSGLPAAIPAHNGVLVLFGSMLAWIGWIGLNAAGAMLYRGVSAERSLLVAVNTSLTAMAGALVAAAVTRIRFRRPDASLIANGWMAGLVSSSAGCAVLKPATAILTGMVAGALLVLSVEWFEVSLKVDDPCGSISVHAVGGLWGVLAAGIFSGGQQLLAQLVGVATLLGFTLPFTYGANWLLSRLLAYRVSSDGERQGLDLHELGADAYPEFVVHSDEFLQR